MKTADMFITGVVGIAIITALALHASSLSSLVKTGSSAASGLMSTVQRG